MIVLDTNVLSEIVARDPNLVVLKWLDGQPPQSIFTTAITKAEMLHGLRLLPSGRRRDLLTAAVVPIFVRDLAGRVLAFDEAAADAYAGIMINRRDAGRPISQSDAQIAAIAVSRGAAVATRNVGDFVDVGAVVINPWNYDG